MHFHLECGVGGGVDSLYPLSRQERCVPPARQLRFDLLLMRFSFPETLFTLPGCSRFEVEIGAHRALGAGNVS